MTILATNLGFPRIGGHRELKTAVESYWAGKSPVDELLKTAASLRARHWLVQQKAGIDHIPSNDFSFYDHVLRPWEPVHSFLWYIWMNPVRKGLCKSPYEYPWSGSLTIDWKRTASVEEQWTPPWKRVANADGIVETPALRLLPCARDVLTENS